MISKELLTLILPYPQNQFVDFVKENDTYLKYGARVQDQINIYELAFRCKDWAKDKEYKIHSSPTQKIEWTAIAQNFDLNKFYYGQNQFYALTEPEAIFKACEWILKEAQK